jgi:LuxR family maltose regulon positive regulatory protein
MWLAAGQPLTARQLLDDATAAVDSGRPAACSSPSVQVALGELDREAGDHQSARRRLDDAATQPNLDRRPADRRRWNEAMADVVQDEGDLESAAQLLEQAQNLDRSRELPDVRPTAARRARLRIVQGRLSEVEQWVREAGVSANDDAQYLREYEHLTFVRLLLARHQAQPEADSAVRDAAQLLDRLLPPAAASHRARSVLEIRVLRALVHQAEGDLPQAERTLMTALNEAPDVAGHAAIFLDAGAPLVELLRNVHQLGDADDATTILNLADRRAGEPTGSGSSPPPALLSPRELEVLTLLDGHLSGPEIARALFISLNTLRAHTKHIFTKLQVTNRRAAVLRARELGLL